MPASEEIRTLEEQGARETNPLSCVGLGDRSTSGGGVEGAVLGGKGCLRRHFLKVRMDR